MLRKVPDRFQAAAVRWHSRFAREVGGVSVADSTLALAALGAMADSLAAGAPALAAICDRYGRGDLVEVLDRALGQT